MPKLALTVLGNCVGCGASATAEVADLVKLAEEGGTRTLLLCEGCGALTSHLNADGLNLHSRVLPEAMKRYLSAISDQPFEDPTLFVALYRQVAAQSHPVVRGDVLDEMNARRALERRRRLGELI